MRRAEPPPLATWILEHGIPGDHAEALSGDLLEGFRSGRSDRWFWHQVLAACAVSWQQAIRVRAPMLTFAFIWSLLAPAWEIYVDRLQSSTALQKLWPLFGGIWIFPALALWLGLHAIFLCAGVFAFIRLQTWAYGNDRSPNVLRRCLLAMAIFAPVYGATFVLANLYWYSFFSHARLAATPLDQITDLGLLADVYRLPTFVALVCSLWNAVRRPTAALRFDALTAHPAAALSELPATAASQTSEIFSDHRFLVLMTAAGVINAMIASFLLCRIPSAHAPTITSFATRAVAYVALALLAGVVAVYLYWHNPSSPFRKAPPLPFPLFALSCAAGWAWIPAMVLFSEQLSAFSAVAGAIGACLLAAGLRHTTSFAFAPPSNSIFAGNSEQPELFTDSLYRQPIEAYGFAIAIALYASGWAIATRSIYTACTLLAIGAFLFAWQRTFAHTGSFDFNREYKRAALRLALVVIPAVLVTLWAMLEGVGHRNQLEAIAIAEARAAAAAKAKPDVASDSISSYHSVILWPPAEKKQILAPIPQPASILAPGENKPLIIRFDGPYWYFQPPNHEPSPHAHQAHGTPLAVDIQTNNNLSLIMEARQPLATPIPLARLREIELRLLNRDNRAGMINVAVLLTDSTAPSDVQVDLGQQLMASTDPAHFTIKFAAPVADTLHFAIPAHAALRKFDGITVMFFPDTGNFNIGRKVAIDQFQLIPR